MMKLSEDEKMCVCAMLHEIEGERRERKLVEYVYKKLSFIVHIFIVSSITPFDARFFSSNYIKNLLFDIIVVQRRLAKMLRAIRVSSDELKRGKEIYFLSTF